MGNTTAILPGKVSFEKAWRRKILSLDDQSKMLANLFDVTGPIRDIKSVKSKR